jgi:hypothetical protein
MKLVAFLMAFLTAAFSCLADYTLEDISPHFPTSTPIIWQAPTNHLPKSFWIYQKSPHVFSAVTISNAIVLASFQDKGFPKPSKNKITLWATPHNGEPRPPYFEIDPELGVISYSLGDRAPDSEGSVSKDAAAIERAWNYLADLDIDRSQFVRTNLAAPGTWGVFFPRQIDGVQMSDDSQGFSFQQIGTDKIRCFSLSLPNLERKQNGRAATPQQIIACIRAFKTPSPPNGDEPDYFARIRNLGNARKVTIVKITPCYGEGIYGETPTTTEPSKIVMPIAELEAIADFGNSNVVVRLYAPLIATEVDRLLSQKKASVRNP